MAKWKPGPGWRATRSGRFAPHYFTASDFSGAQTVAAVFKVVGWIVMVGGAIADWETRYSLQHSGGTRGGHVALELGIALATILLSATIFFFGYVLQLLVALHFDSRLVEAARRADQSVASR